MKDEKTQGQTLFEQLSCSSKNGWEQSDENFKSKAFEFCEGYKKFLDNAKTEREFVNEAEQFIKSQGFVPLHQTKTLVPGMKVYEINKNKSMAIAVIGKKELSEGINVLGAHIDSPRIDLKPYPLYEDSEMVFLNTHYYGGIKKYQWVTIPLAIHGVVIKSDGTKVNITIGENENDPVFTITDLLPHLAQDQMQKKMSEAITGEDLNVLFGSMPYNDEKVKEKFKLNILKLLNDKYKIIEEDFVSAELEMVPAFKSKDVGLDRSLIGAYGQDDRVCAYPALKAICDIEIPNKTSICLLTDKEEVGSMGNTGAKSRFFENFVASLCKLQSPNSYSDILFRTCLSNSKMLSADVNAALDPTYAGVYDKKNSSYIGKGIVLEKYTGSRGKSGASDANAEFIGEVRKVFNEHKILWQAAELGKVDQGGGGTIAQYMANLDMDVLDCGIALLSMHAPFEVASKIDIYITYNAYKVFINI